MGTKSILELDEAKRRLEQMDSDHRTIVELVQKLKSVRESLTATLDTATSRLRQIEQLGERFAKVEGEMAKSLEAFRKQSQTCLSAVQSAVIDMETKHARFVQAGKEQLVDLEANLTGSNEELHKRFDTWIESQEKRLDQFEEHHRVDLERVAKAYERAKASLDSHTPLLDGLDSRVERILAQQDRLGTSVQMQLAKATEQVEGNVATIRSSMEAFRSASDARWEELSRDWSSKVGNIEQSIREHALSESKKASEVILKLQKRVGRIRFALWLVMLVGVSMVVTYAISNWAQTLTWWNTIADYARKMLI